MLEHLAAVAREFDPVLPEGRVVKVVGLTIEALGPSCRIGEVCTVRAGEAEVPCEVVGFREDRVLLMPLGRMDGIAPGAPVLASGERLQVTVGPDLVGRVLDGLGRPMDGRGPLAARLRRPIDNDPPPPLSRPPITEALGVGVRAIDGLLTCGRGQRLGIFAGSGVGKSTLLAMIARNAQADVTVIGLVGERGREVREFVEQDLGPQGLARSVVVAATSDEPPLVRIKAAHTATAVAEYFRDQGADVVLLMDSVTRFAMALREVGLAVGEPPASRGYTPSVFSALPRLLERSGRSHQGSITGFYTVLVEGDDFNEPVTDTVRGILDGHVVLSRDLAQRGHYPAIDVPASVSRLMGSVAGPAQCRAAARLRELLAGYRDGRDLVQIGAYRQGTDPVLDEALRRLPLIDAFLRQGVGEASSLDETVARLLEVVGMDGDAA
ncbi:MAG TPA: FliI/YscN family ATPase [Bacillota bacterium]